MPSGTMTGSEEHGRHRGAVLLTGATGFVGGELLARLLARDPRPIVCLVRAPSHQEAAARGRLALAASLERAPTAHENARVTWIAGDVSRRGLGLRFDHWRPLAERVEEIFHCAASTRFDLPLDEAHAVNVRGLEEIYDLADAAIDTGRFRRLHHVSTAFASGRRSERIDATTLPPDRASAFRNTYERTKARAERLLRSQERVPYTIYRPSIIVGGSRDGRTRSWNVVYFPMRLMATGRLPFAPAGRRALLDCVPVDFVVDAILALAARPDTVGRVLHLTAGDDAVTVPDVVAHTYAGLARHRGAPVRIRTRLLGPIAWWAFSTISRLALGERARRALDRFQPYGAYTRMSGIFDNTLERALAAEEGVRLPPPHAFFPRVVDYALRHDFGRRPAPTIDRADSDVAHAPATAAGGNP